METPIDFPLVDDPDPSIGLPHLPGCSAVDPSAVAGAIEHINKTVHRHKLGLALELGEFLLATFFNGSSNAFASHGDAHASYRALAQHPGLSVSHSFLYICVKVSLQSRVLPDDVMDSHLSITHHKQLLAVPDRPAKVRLARQAAEGNWSTRRLQQAVAAWQAGNVPNRRVGRPRLSPVERSAGLLRKGARALPQGLDIQVDELSEAQLTQLLSVLGPVVHQVNDLWNVVNRAAEARGVHSAAA